MFDARPVSLVLSLLPAPAIAGTVVGRAEVVDTGEVIAVRGTDDLVALVSRLAREQRGRV